MIKDEYSHSSSLFTMQEIEKWKSQNSNLNFTINIGDSINFEEKVVVAQQKEVFKEEEVEVKKVVLNHIDY